jgi:hypothetical protein
VGVDLHDAIVLDVFIFVLLHEEFEVTVIDEDGAVLFHDDIVVEGVHEGNGDLQLVDLLQSVLGGWVNFVDAELVLAKGVEVVVRAEFKLLDVCGEVVLADLLGVEVEKGDLGLGLSGLAEEIVHLGLLSLLEGNDAIEGV